MIVGRLTTLLDHFAVERKHIDLCEGREGSLMGEHKGKVLDTRTGGKVDENLVTLGVARQERRETQKQFVALAQTVKARECGRDHLISIRSRAMRHLDFDSVWVT